jgi:Pretoxin HINT domain
MRGFPLSAACAVVVVSSFLSDNRTLGESKRTESQPQALVQAALKAELTGHSVERAALLEQALALDPDFAPARWQSGFVRWDGQWLKVDEVPGRARDNEQLAAYRKQRDQLIDTADNHRALAQWCHKHQLPDEERVHWAKVLEFDPRDAEAMSGLGLELYKGRLLTRQQIGEEKERAGEQLRAMRHWQPKLLKLRGAIERGNARQRDAALRELAALDDPAAVPSLEAVFAVTGESRKSIDLNRILIETVSRMPSPAASHVLIRRAVMPEAERVRAMAIAQMKKGPKHAYVPALIAAMPATLQTAYQMYFLPNGALAVQAELLSKRGSAEHRESSDLSLYFINREMYEAPDLKLAFASRLLTPVREMETAEQRCRQISSRVRIALKELTGFADTDDAELWAKNWSDFNESLAGSYWPSPVEQTSEKYAGSVVVLSCFAGDTPVLTWSGFEPIAKVKSGDRVLAQDPITGELAYKTVQAKTLRAATPMINVHVGSETVQATRGHLFWVDGKGWLMAKHLESGMMLHTLSGARSIDQLTEAAPGEAYNLVVSDFCTYFVGQERLLVHDNSPREFITPRVPGLIGDIGEP